MKYSTIERTDARVSRISFGTASLHHLFSARQRRRLLETAASSGITHFDTSPYYGYGLAEYDLGRFMQGSRDSLTVTTKIGLYPFGGATSRAVGVWARKAAGKLYPRLSLPEIDWSVRRAAESLNASLGRLKTDYVDFLFLHEPVIGMLNAEEVLRWLEAEKSKGKVRYWGIAGLPALIEPWLRVDHPLANILQVKDSLEEHEADFVLENKRGLQFTYGYLSSVRSNALNYPADQIIRGALMRNTQGSVLVSTRKAERIKVIARQVE